jgi:hypothetical protein
MERKEPSSFDFFNSSSATTGRLGDTLAAESRTNEFPAK